MPFIVIHTLTLFTAVIDAYSVDLETSAAHFELDSRNTATMTDSGESNTHTNQTSPCESCAPLDVYLQGFFHSSKENATLVRIRHGLGKSHSPPKKRTDTRSTYAIDCFEFLTYLGMFAPFVYIAQTQRSGLA
jgi:hypothetical protein